MLIILLFGLILLRSTASEMPDSTAVHGPGSYKILHNTNMPLRIPFKMHNDKPLMKLTINGIKATLMIDNGILWDQVWLFGSPLVEQLQLKPVEESELGGAGEGDPTQAFTSDNLTLQFEDIVFYEQPVLVSPPAAGFSKMFPGVDGQLCNTFFKHFIVEFDFEQNFIILHDPKHFKFESSGSIIDMRANESGTYSIPFTFTLLDGKVYTDSVDIDFGGVYPLKIALNNKHNIQLPADATPVFSYGAQGKATEFSGKIKCMTVGNYTFDYPITVFGDERTSRIHPDNLGVIGLPLFMKFNTIFDYFNTKLYLTPNENFNTSFE